MGWKSVLHILFWAKDLPLRFFAFKQLYFCFNGHCASDLPGWKCPIS